MVAAAIRLSLQEAESPAKRPGATGPASLKTVAAAAQIQRSRSGGSSGSPPRPPRLPFRSKSAGENCLHGVSCFYTTGSCCCMEA